MKNPLSFLTSLGTLAWLGGALVVSLAMPASASAAREELLAETRLANHTDVDFVPVRSCRDGHEFVSAIQIRVLRDTADIDQVLVQFGDRSIQELHVREVFTPRIPSRWIPLDGGKRCVRGLRVIGKSGPRAMRSLVQVFGMTHPMAE